MKISFWISAIVLYMVSVAFSNSVQVGTVLFTTTDLIKKCWTESDKALLKARLIMQDVLPDPDCIDFSKPEAAVILLDYFHACYQIISTSTYGKIQNLMYLALSDALGGYLRAYVLPFTRRAYYAGQMKYSEAKKLFQLYDDIKLFLKTSGMGWAEPQKVCYRKFRVKPLVITGGSLEACNQLYTIEMGGRPHCINPVNRCALEKDDIDFNFPKNYEENLREDIGEPNPSSRSFNSSSPVCRDTNCHGHPFRKAKLLNHRFFNNLPKNRSQQLLRDKEIMTNRKSRSQSIFHRKVPLPDAKRVIIPLPVLDDCSSPHSIAVPFRRRPFRNLVMRNSAFILEYYYLAVIKCFIAKGNSRTDIKNFNSQFHAWMVSQIYPHLNDEKWYPAFGGVLRVTETIRKFGTETTAKDPVMHDIAYMFGKGVEFDITEDTRQKGRDKVRDVTEVEDCHPFPRRHYLTTILLVSLIWIFIFCLCAFFCQATKGSNLLYEGCSEASSHFRRMREVDPRDDRFIDFQFLVRFFKKKDDSTQKKEQIYHCFAENEKNKKIFQGDLTKQNDTLEDKCQCMEQSKKDSIPGKESQEGKPKEKRLLTLGGIGDIPTFLMHKSDEMEHNLEIRPPRCVVPSRKTEKTEQRDDKRGWEKQEEQGRNELQMLWKKPSAKFKRNVPKDEETAKDKSQRIFKSTTTTMSTCDDLLSKTSLNSCSASLEDETKGSSTEKRSSTCCCSESCMHSNTTSTNSSLQSQLEDKSSSATMRLFEKVIARHRSHRKSSTQESTAESLSEGDDSYTSESDY